MNGYLFVIQTIAIIVAVASYALASEPLPLTTPSLNGNSTYVFFSSIIEYD